MTFKENSTLVELFSELGLNEKKAQETIKNKKLSEQLVLAIESSGCSLSERREKGTLLYNLASTCNNKACESYLPYISQQIGSGNIISDVQLQEAIKYISKITAYKPFSESDFKEACGIGISVPHTHIHQVVTFVVKECESNILKERYSTNQGVLMRKIREKDPSMKWAEGRIVKQELDMALECLLGAKTEQDKLLKAKRAPVASISIPVTTSLESHEEAFRKFEGEVLKFHKPGENPQINEEIRLKHLKETSGKYITRFPPEPNGFLHIGHAKAMNFNFRFAELHQGITYLRYDDTNPEAEKPIYYQSIKDAVEWMGFKSYKITAASDYFQQLYEYAVILIKKGFAYVCHQTSEEIHASRGGDTKGPRTISPWRNRSIEENLCLFEDMKNGKFKEGEATLRLKMDMENPNPFMWDLVAYRVLYTPHCRTGNQWCIYPMYDFTHCLCDSIENITHSLCTTEFIAAREAYYWVCDHVEVYKAVQWEYGRLCITNTVLSKRKLTKLVQEGIVNGWDDPRIYTLAAVRRRGFPPKAINKFVERLGITTSMSVIDVRLLESVVREELNETAPRRMALLDPVMVIIDNLKEDHLEMIQLYDFVDKGSQTRVPFTRKIWIDRNDFSADTNDENFYRLTMNQPVGLYKACIIECVNYETKDGKVSLIHARMLPNGTVKPKTFIQWIAESPNHSSPIHCEVRIYHPLFKSVNPDAVPEGFMSDIRHDSLEILKNSIVDCRLSDAKVEERFQFQRIGYFCVDPDTNSGNQLVFNLTVSLKEDSSKTY